MSILCYGWFRFVNKSVSVLWLDDKSSYRGGDSSPTGHRWYCKLWTWVWIMVFLLRGTNPSPVFPGMKVDDEINRKTFTTKCRLKNRLHPRPLDSQVLNQPQWWPCLSDPLISGTWEADTVVSWLQLPLTKYMCTRPCISHKKTKNIYPEFMFLII